MALNRYFHGTIQGIYSTYDSIKTIIKMKKLVSEFEALEEKQKQLNLEENKYGSPFNKAIYQPLIEKINSANELITLATMNARAAYVLLDAASKEAYFLEDFSKHQELILKLIHQSKDAVILKVLLSKIQIDHHLFANYKTLFELATHAKDATGLLLDLLIYQASYIIVSVFNRASDFSNLAGIDKENSNLSRALTNLIGKEHHQIIKLFNTENKLDNTNAFIELVKKNDGIALELAKQEKKHLSELFQYCRDTKKLVNLMLIKSETSKYFLRNHVVSILKLLNERQQMHAKQYFKTITEQDLKLDGTTQVYGTFYFHQFEVLNRTYSRDKEFFKYMDPFFKELKTI